MQKYLGELVSEYEQLRPLGGPKATEIPLGDLKDLSDFLDKGKQSRFRQKFAGGHAEARSAIRADLATLTSKQ